MAAQVPAAASVRADPRVALPDVVHRVVELPASVQRVVIVGDVHACLDELHALLAACAFHASRDQLVLVGDLVNKGPKSVEVVRFARESNALCVRGNHDDAALAAYYDWRESGGSMDEGSKYAYVTQFTPEDVRFLEQIPFTISLPSHSAIVVHAGLVPGVPLSAQKPIDMYKMRFLVRRSRPHEEDREGDDASSSSWAALETKKDAEVAGESVHLWATRWEGTEHVYFGHDAVAGLQQEAFATGLDTGCCYGRELTACILPSREIIRVKAKRVRAKSALQRPIKIPLDDVDSAYGLHSYIAAVTIRTFDKVLWEKEFYGVAFESESENPAPKRGREPYKQAQAKAVELLDDANNGYRDRERCLSTPDAALPVATDAISYAMDNALIVDLNVWEGSSACAPVWGLGKPLPITRKSARDGGGGGGGGDGASRTAVADFSLSVGEKQSLVLLCQDASRGNGVAISLEKIGGSSAASKKTRVFVKQIELTLSLPFIDATFGTGYATWK